MKELTLKESMDRLNYLPRPTPHRVNLQVPFSEKDQAKALGAKWDKSGKTWYINADMDMLKFRKWIDRQTLER